MPPNVSVIMPVFNGERFLKEALLSVFSQSYSDFEIIVINDGSTDKTGEILNCYQNLDKRLKVINQPNQGPATARNAGFRSAKGKYIVLLDADDINYPHRLEKTVTFMEKNPEIIICGSWAKTLSQGKSQIIKAPVGSDRIKCELLISSPFINSTVIMRKDLITRSNLEYDEKFSPSEDYDLWVRAADFGKMQNLPEPLVYYRLHNQQLTQKDSSKQKLAANKIRSGYFLKLGIELTKEEQSLHEAIVNKSLIKNDNNLLQLENWLLKLQRANLKEGLFPVRAFNEMIAEHWYGVCLKMSQTGYNGWKKFSHSELSSLIGLSSRNKFKYFLRCTQEYLQSKIKGTKIYR